MRGTRGPGGNGSWARRSVTAGVGWFIQLAKRCGTSALLGASTPNQTIEDRPLAKFETGRRRSMRLGEPGHLGEHRFTQLLLRQIVESGRRAHEWFEQLPAQQQGDRIRRSQPGALFGLMLRPDAVEQPGGGGKAGLQFARRKPV